MKTIILLSIFAFSHILTNAQNNSANRKTTLINLTVSGMDDSTIETIVSFDNVSSHFSFHVNKKGNAKCIVPVGEKYSITILESEDSYDYDIPDYTEDTLELKLKFNINNNPRDATKSNTVIAIKILNNPGIDNLTVLSKNKSFNKIARVINDTEFIKLPVNNIYTITENGIEIKNNIIHVDNTEYNILYYVLYFKDHKHAELFPINEDSAVMYLSYHDLSDKAVCKEFITIKSSKNNLYKVLTNINGNGLIFLPKNDSYKLSLKYYPDFANISIDKKQSTLTVNSVGIKFPSSLQYEQLRKAETARIKTRDSLYKIYGKSKELTGQLLINDLKSSMPQIIDSLTNNIKYFENKKNVACAVLYRNRGKWKSKMVVTDVTGSMYPYMRQIGMWHLLELIDKENSQYVFFNDGDGIPDFLKVIGNTGGIYYVPSNQPDSVIKIMCNAMQNGDGGDAPENDIEALIRAQEKITSDTTQLILIADNYSPFKDISLLNKIKVPVRVILCGENGWINMDCLELAYKTGGSIHTIEEDINNLSSLHDGESITIGGKAYQFMKGKFFPVTSNL